MNMRFYLLGALMALGLSTAGQAQKPRPGTLETYGDWTVGCDNQNHCEAVSLQPDSGDWPDKPLTVRIERSAGPDAEAQFWVEGQDGQAGRVSFLIDGLKVASGNVVDQTARVQGPQASAIIVSMAAGRVMDVKSGNGSFGRVSLKGSAAAFRYMDAKQGRAGTITALVATGALGKTAVRPAPPAPIIQAAPLMANSTLPAALWREELAALAKVTGCSVADMSISNGIRQYRLSRTQTLLLVSCGSGAYNSNEVPIVATGVAGRRAFQWPNFDYAPGWSEDPKKPMLINGSYSIESGVLGSYAKGRGIGDCGGSEAYVWDGSGFRLHRASAMNECRGSWYWISTWTADVQR